MTTASRKRPKHGTPRNAELQWSQALTGFFAHLVEQERTEQTQKAYRADLLQFGKWYRDHTDELPLPALIQPGELREWKTHLKDQCHHEPASINRRIASIRSFLKWCAGEGIAPDIQTPRSIRQVQPPPRWLEPKEKRALIRALDRFCNARDPAMVRLLLHTGIRVDELVHLQWTDIAIKDRSGTLTVREGKGRKKRTIPLNAEARAALTELRVIAGNTRKPTPVVSGQQGALTARGIQLAVAKAGALAKLEDVTPHVLRHTCAHDLAVAGVAIQVIADVMGHESLETTRRYVQPGRQDLATAMEQIAGGTED
jgi:site-specific recombinase XerD